MKQVDSSDRRVGGTGLDFMSGLSVVSIGKSFGSRVVLRDLSLGVSHGEIVGLLGPDGAGKTTCFYSIIGLLVPDNGRILLNGYDVTQLPMYRRALLGLGYLPEEPSIFRGLTVAQNVRALLEIYEPDAHLIEPRIEALLRRFHIDHLRDMPATRLSGGERRRCEIARAMAATPTVMLLDEPFAGIDPLTIADVKAMVLGLKASGVGVLVTDYDVQDLFEIIDRAYVIYDGRILAHGTPEALAGDESVRRLFLGQDFSL